MRINEVYLIERIVLFSCGSRRGGVNPRIGKIGVFLDALFEARRGDEKTRLRRTFRVRLATFIFTPLLTCNRP
ncbi:hypothetical protein [Paraburkholderia sp. BL21I4N1]|uniref:hypothetical protein n=1 Tax=Paraburkholderia sp. BL21I4N1 TaxID=1938801 RepID=UPI0011B29EB7|nr:hypothetical protein [Paraburkholderia sp. BL21I4N1]